MSASPKERAIFWAEYYGEHAALYAVSDMENLAFSHAKWAASAAFSAYPELREEKK